MDTFGHSVYSGATMRTERVNNKEDTMRSARDRHPALFEVLEKNKRLALLIEIKHEQDAAECHPCRDGLSMAHRMNATATVDDSEQNYVHSLREARRLIGQE